ncbi:MAG TPA: TadE/TadG family type IV pilus assembly protein [Candidatus Acidoferrales bacterium]|nr:TadE/TadG family type IV pilus assembly protein [Candidatus Acidoferrales bacterium]
MRSGQSLLELAICLPILLLLALGTVEVVRVADVRSGLDAATAAAAAAAARASDAGAAAQAGQARFREVLAGYPAESPALSLDLGGFGRGAVLTATGSAAAPGLPGSLRLTAVARAVVEPWRSR